MESAIHPSWQKQRRMQTCSETKLLNLDALLAMAAAFGNCLVQPKITPAPGVAAQVEVHIGGAASPTIGLTGPTPLAPHILKPWHGTVTSCWWGPCMVEKHWYLSSCAG